MKIAEPFYSRIHELANFIEEALFKFDMAESFVNPACGTSGCIAGHAAMLWPEVRMFLEFDKKYTWSEERINKHLGLDHYHHSRLFYANPHMSKIWKFVDRAKAVDTLRRYAETGVVDFQFTQEQIDSAKQ